MRDADDADLLQRGTQDDPGFTLTQLRYFAIAAETGSMTATARAMHASQSAVSNAIAQLEKHLRVQLFLRHHARGLTLTPAGREFVLQSRDLLARANDMLSLASGLGDSVEGEVKLGCYHTLSPFYLPRILKQVGESYPLLSIRVLEGEKRDVFESLLTGEAEIALTYGSEVPGMIATEALAVSAPYVIVHERHRLALRSRRRRITLAELAQDRMILLDMPFPGRYFLDIAENNGLRPQIAFSSPNFETVRSMVAAGLGYSILNQRPVHDLTYDGGRVVALELEDTFAPVPLVMATVRGSRLTTRAETVAALLRAAVPSIADELLPPRPAGRA